MTDILQQSIALPCGTTLPNRIAKAAMTEGLADDWDNPTDELSQLYSTWSASGAGLLITGNVQVDRRYLERAGNVVLDDQTDTDALARWAAAGTEQGNHLWMQISHPGRQCQRMVNGRPVAPSEVGIKLAGLFAQPRALKEDEIRELIDLYANASFLAQQAGFTGVQIHAAHGYLISQFLSPRVNQRQDEWGGTLENRARFLLEIVDATRARVGPEFPICVKLNSADFSKGGFSHEDSVQVAAWLGDHGIDLLELSGGTYESIAFLKTENDKSESTKAREAYFIEYAEAVRAATQMPLMLTGGFRTVEFMREAIQSGAIDVVGVGRPFCVVPDFPKQVFAGDLQSLPTPEDGLRLGPGGLGPGSGNSTVRAFNSQAQTAWFYHQILEIGAGRSVPSPRGAWSALTGHLTRDASKNMARKSKG